MDNKDVRKRFARLLMDDYWSWANQQRKSGEIGIPTRQEYCTAKGIEYGSWANWSNGYRLPDETNRKKLAQVIGPKVYEVLGEAPPIPKELAPLVGVVSQLSEVNQRRLMEAAERLHREEQNKTPQSAAITQS